ncbi:phage tail protein [Gynuella sp.]|uniref:phage tail protein n=1 Tax=Gynuella sp. TaxID=2969146 RepID=UPI003D100D13
MSNPFLGEVRMIAFTFAPRGWSFCAGQLLTIGNNAALYSVLGVSYGGNGVNTFGVPNLSERVPMHAGTGPGLTSRQVGEKAGSDTASLSVSQIPSHDHQQLNTGISSPANITYTATQDSLLSQSLNVGGGRANAFGDPSPQQTDMHPKAIGFAGGNQEHYNMQPFICINFCICLDGMYPARN